MTAARLAAWQAFINAEGDAQACVNACLDAYLAKLTSTKPEPISIEEIQGIKDAIDYGERDAAEKKFEPNWQRVEHLHAMARVLLSHITAIEADRDRLEKLVYVPGLWRCPKCEFQLVQAVLYAKTGNVGPHDKPGEKCPNCTSPLWRVTEREAGNNMVDRCEKELLRANAAEADRDRMREALEDAEAVLISGCRMSPDARIIGVIKAALKSSKPGEG